VVYTVINCSMICYSTLIQGQDKCARVDQKKARQSEVYKWLESQKRLEVFGNASVCCSG